MYEVRCTTVAADAAHVRCTMYDLDYSARCAGNFAELRRRDGVRLCAGLIRKRRKGGCCAFYSVFLFRVFPVHSLSRTRDICTLNS